MKKADILKLSAVATIFQEGEDRQNRQRSVDQKLTRKELEERYCPQGAEWKKFEESSDIPNVEKILRFDFGRIQILKYMHYQKQDALAKNRSTGACYRHTIYLFAEPFILRHP